ncbi:MAG: capsule assembly Wzi family protein [Armatimonadota bacterium]
MRKAGFLLIILLIASCACAEMSIPSFDRLPIGDWSYDAMASLATDGLVPGLSARVFQGDRLMTRMEMAEVVASVLAGSPSLSDSQAALADKLYREFRPEIASVAPNCPEPPIAGRKFLLLWQAKLLAAEDSDNESISAISGFGNISDHRFAIATYADSRENFLRDTQPNRDPDKAVMRGFDANFKWSLGREYINLSPSYIGSLVVSGNSGSFVQARGTKEIDFGKLLGRVRLTQFVSGFRDRGERLYLTGRRWEKPVSNHLHVGLNETAKTNTVPNPIMMVMPFYLYQHLFFDETDAKFNAVYGLDMLYREGDSEWYCEWMVDDMSSPKILGRKYPRPKKTGLTLGYYKAWSPKTNLRAEWVSIDRQTYEATRDEVPELAFRHDGWIIGSPIGPNANAVYLRGEHYLSDKWSVIAEYLNRTQKSPEAPLVGSERMLSILAAYDISPDRSISLRVAPYRDGSEEDTLYEVRATSAF